MASLIFVTLNNGKYQNHWTSDLCTLLQSKGIAGYRRLCWYGQNCGRRDYLVRPGTIVAVRENDKVQSFTLVGFVAEIHCLQKQQNKVPGMYEIIVEVSDTPETIDRDYENDAYTHWTVLRRVGIETTDAQPQGIYASALK